MKTFKSENYNFIFDQKTGFFARWGKTKDDDPTMSPFGNEILDIEVTDICKGPGGKVCPFCYKSNSLNNKNNMSLKKFQDIIDRMPETITQIAIGADAQCESNPDIWDMMKYAIYKKIVPNITVADISGKVADNLVKYCGAVAVSRYADKEYCYNSIKKLVDRGMKQVNIHIMVSDETKDMVYETFNDSKTDPRLKGLNAIVLLSLKQKGRGEHFNILPQKEFKKIVHTALKKDIPIGFDSCSCHKFLDSIKGIENYDKYEMLSEPCESGIFSAYINVFGDFFPCSFTEGTKGWETGIPVDTCVDFLKDIWYNERTKEFRERLFNNERKCPIFEV